MKKRVAIIISGGGSNMVALVESMTEDHPCEAALVVSNIAGAGGLAKARALGVKTCVVEHKSFDGDRHRFDAALNAQLVSDNIDILCFAGFMRVLTAEFTDLWQNRALNIHPSLLPKYPGLNTHSRAIAAGDSEGGCSVHEVTAELDSGPLHGQAQVPILPGDTPETLAARVLIHEHRLYPQVLRRFAQGQRDPLTL